MSSEELNRWVKATRLYAALRCDMESIDPDVESGEILTVAGRLGVNQWTTLAQRYGINPPSIDTLEVVRDVAFLFVEADERFATLPRPEELLR